MTDNDESMIVHAERQLYREKVGELLAEKILFITESMNRPSYVPKMPNQPELDLIFDTSFIDIQPYLFKVSRKLVIHFYFTLLSLSF